MINPSTILAGLPTGLRDPLLKSYEEIVSNYAEHRWEPAELNGGKFCEIVYSIIEGTFNKKFPSKPCKPKDMLKACRNLEGLPADPNRIGDRSLRILIPRILIGLYEIRNNRNVGHVGGDVDPNFLDATVVYGMVSWVLAEIIRIFHSISTTEAQDIVDVLIERKYSLIWEVSGTKIKRVLDPKMDKGDQALLLLHSKPSWVTEEDLFQWVEYSSSNMFRRRILQPFHSARLIEYDKKQSRVKISPLGSIVVEQKILKTHIS